MTTSPVVAAIFFTTAEDDEGKNYELYCDAYGLEMQIDNEWNAEVILLAPHDHLGAVTESTSVTGEDAAIVTAGVTDVPISEHGTPDFSVINDPRNNWLLVGDPRNNDTDETINLKLRGALDAGCRVIFCTSEKNGSQLLAPLFKGLGPAELSRIIIAVVLDKDADEPDVVQRTVQAIRDQFRSTVGTTERLRFIVASQATAEKAVAFVSLQGVDGVLLIDSDYCKILDVLVGL